jgi:hypothetical protein
MSEFEELKPNVPVRGIPPEDLAGVDSAQWFGYEPLELARQEN